MKTIIKIGKILGLSFILSILFFSCDIVALGGLLDLEGPVVSFTSPARGEAVTAQFILEGVIQDLSGVKEVLVTVQRNNQDFPKQWRYINGVWTISEDSGATWNVLHGAEWIGDSKNAIWKIPIDLSLNGADPLEGQYLFTVQAWDISNNSDDNSYKTLVLIIDNDPPLVSIVNPYVHSRFIIYDDSKDEFTDDEFQKLYKLSGDDWKNPAMIGKFQTRGFDLQFQIDDFSQIQSMDLRFYDATAAFIDQEEDTELPDDYIYRYVNPNVPQRPNDTIKIPKLTGPIGSGYDKGGEIKNPVTEKTIIMIVTVCYDQAGNVNQEKILGYIIYWPEADFPWITFTADLKLVSDYDHINTEEDLKKEEDIFMIYPGRSIKANAYHYYGVEKVHYFLYKYNPADKDNSNKGLTLVEETITKQDGTVLNFRNGITAVNEERGEPGSGIYSTTFQWEVDAPPRTAFYVVKAAAYSADNIGDLYEGLFLVQDISFPDFTTPVSPSASEPLFTTLKDNKIEITGRVADATEVTSLYLVWINPRSENYRAMSQLRYFREPNYQGWRVVNERKTYSPQAGVPESTWGETTPLAVGSFTEEGYYDPAAPNKVWNVQLTEVGINENDRMEYQYSQVIDLTTHMNIGGTDAGVNDFPLGSQTFLLRAENPDGKTTVITYAPQGDMSPPEITITSVVVSGGQETACIPGQYALIEQFKANETITINGHWKEDSTGFLAFESYLKNNFTVELNGEPKTITEFTPSAGNATEGTFKVVIPLNTQAEADAIKDTLSVTVELFDIGGNKSAHTASWLIRSDVIQLMRISSDNPDTKYRQGDKINIFLEFNKPVWLKNTVNTNPRLQLNITGGPIYADFVPGTTYNTRQNFEYTVGSGHATSGNVVLDVIGINAGGIAWNADNYPFTWITAGTDSEEIRITTRVEDLDGGKPSGANFHAKKLPLYDDTSITPNNRDRIYTLRSGKSIEIDTSSPTVSSVTSSNPFAHYSSGQIFINIKFSENIKIDGSAPSLNMGGFSTARSTPSSAIINGDTITFSYSIVNGDTTNGNPLTVTGINNSASIKDLAGNQMVNPAWPITVTTTPAGGIFIDTLTPSPPIVKINTVAENTQNNYNSVFSNRVNGGLIPARSDTGDKDLKNIYVPIPTSPPNCALWLAIDGVGDAHQIGQFEYTINANASTPVWTRVPESGITGNYFVLPIDKPGIYQISARQISKAGISSNTNVAAGQRQSPVISFNYDPGAFVTYITSTNANNTYVTGQDINITATLRKAVTFNGTSNASITLNAANNNGVNKTFSTTTGGSSLTWTYTVQANDHIDNNPNPLVNLNVTNLTALTGARDSDGVDISDYIGLPAGANSNLGQNKQITIDTRPFTVTTAPRFVDDTGWGIQGIRTDDGSYWTTLEIEFSKPPVIGSGRIEIIQNAANYRVPVVLTEAQYNRFKAVSTLAGVIDDYYTKGTNGYKDTATKYTLKYIYHPQGGLAASGTIPGAAVLPTSFSNVFRDAEKISISAASQAVEIDGNKLKIRLTGSNAPQVPGAAYTVTYPAGFVQDALGNLCAEATNTTYNNVTLEGVAKPFVRIRKTQDTITAVTGSTTQSKYQVELPMTAYARIDSRTPGSLITYTTNTSDTDVTGPNRDTIPTNAEVGPPTADPDGDSNYSDNTQITLQSATAANNNQTTAQGFQWRVKTRAYIGSNTEGSRSFIMEDIAYRTVITLVTQGMNAGTLNPDGSYRSGRPLEAGDQIWIRGGDAPGSSSIPGFPLTWLEDWGSLTGKRAGIRLFRKNNTTSDLNSSEFKFVTWDINATAYLGFMLGVDTDTSPDAANMVWQYGPETWSSIRLDWADQVRTYPVEPGGHRWLNANGMNFTTTPSVRPAGLTVDSSGVNTQFP